MNINHNLAVSAIEGIPVREPLRPEFNSMALFDDMYAYYNCSRVFYAYFGAIPSILALKHIDPNKMMRWIESRYAPDIENLHYRKMSKGKGRGFSKSNAIYVLRNRMVVDLESDRSVRIYFLPESEAQAYAMASELEVFIQKPKQQQLAIVANKGNGLELMHFQGRKVKTDLRLHYNDDLIALHQSLLKSLATKNCC